jgi:anaerobic magnesium-protoporphyrin IX monomethyl ester cyclase
MNDIVLIRPPALGSQSLLSTAFPTPPLGIAYLSGTLRAHGFTPQTIDALGSGINTFTSVEDTVAFAQGLEINEIIDRISPNAKIIGYSAMFSYSWIYDKKILQRIRDRFPDAIIVAGGEHITACAEYVLKDCPAVNICARGEGEETFLDIVKTVYEEKNLQRVDGISYIKNGCINSNPSRARIQNIDKIPEPYWDDLPLEAYLSNGYSHGVNLGRSMPILATRGCPYLRTFCSSPFMWTTRWEARSPQLVFEEIVSYIKKYRVNNFDFYDLTAIVKKSWIVEFCDIIINSGQKFTWQLPSGTRSEAIDAEVVDKLFMSGCRHMNYAPESGSPEVLARIKKKVSLSRMLESLRSAVKRGLKVKVNMIFSFPNDTPYDLWLNFKFGISCAWHGAIDSSFTAFVPYPGSELYLDLVKQNKIKPMSDDFFKSLMMWFSNIEICKSYNPYLKEWQFKWIRYLYFVLFYSVMYLRWPMRLIKTAKNLFLGNPESQGEEVLANIFSKKLPKILRTMTKISQSP